jgi:branched-subunit amino acid ABC-type transport system permease component
MTLEGMLLNGLAVITTGLVVGAIFSLVAAGVTIMYGTIWLPNASNGQFFMLAALLLWSLVNNWGLSPYLGAAVIITGAIPFSLLLERFLIRPFYNVPNRNIVYFIMTLGLAQIFAGAFTGTYGQWSDNYSLPAAWPGALMIGPFPFPPHAIFGPAHLFCRSHGPVRFPALAPGGAGPAGSLPKPRGRYPAGG